MRESIVAVALLTREDLELLGPAFERAWPVEQVPGFEELLRAIDEADRNLNNDADVGPSGLIDQP